MAVRRKGLGMDVIGGASTFVLVDGVSLSAGGVADENCWVTPLDPDLEVGCLALGLDDADSVEVASAVVDSPVPEAAAADGSVEVSLQGPCSIVNDAGEWHPITPPEPSGIHRVRFTRTLNGDQALITAEAWPETTGRPMKVFGPVTAGIHPLLLIPEAGPGLAGSRRIGGAIEANADFSHDNLTGVARAGIEVRGRVRYLSEYFESGHVWTPNEEGYMWYTSAPMGVTYLRMRDENHPDRLCGWGGAITTTSHPDSAPPGRMVNNWNWLKIGHDRADLRSNTVLPQDSVCAVTLKQVPGDVPKVRVEVEHSGLPEVWAADMSDWWQYQLAIRARRAE